MKIGLTYDLRDDYLKLGFGELETAEFDRPDTIDAIDATLQELGHQTDRIGNIRSLVSRLNAGSRWDLVFNIAEGMYGIGREAQVPALLEAYDIPYTFSDSMVLSLTLHKGMTKRVFRDLGVPTPAFAEIRTEADIGSVDLPYPLFAKPMAEGTGKGITPASKIRDKQGLRATCTSLLNQYPHGVLVETFLPGREFTAGIAGTDEKARVLGVMEIVMNDKAEKDAYTYINKEFCEDLVRYVPVDDAEALLAASHALDAWRGLGCRDAGRVDLKSDADGIPNVMEINPLAGIHPQHSDLPIICGLFNISYRQLFEMILESAMRRVKG